MLRKQDVRERFIRSSGPGGQNINKVASCVSLRHLPTGIEVKCQKERSQGQNRFLAWRILGKKVADYHLRQQADALQKREKIRRQQRKKPRSLKIRILEAKRRQSQKKLLRQKIRQSDE